MKQTLLALLFVTMFVVTSCSVPGVERGAAPNRLGWTSNQQPPLYGDVAEVKISTYDSRDATAEIDKNRPVSTVLYYFNDGGNVVKREVYNDGTTVPIITERYNYNANGSVAEMFATHTADHSQGEWQTTYNYDGRGLLVEERVFYATEKMMSAIWRYEYDSRGDRIHASKFDGGDLLIWETFWEYDQMGRVAKESRRNYEDASNMGDTCYKYAADGRLVEKADFLPDYENETKIITTYSYDKCGRVSEQIIEGRNREILSSISYTYDKQDNVVEEVVRGDNRQIEQIVKYDIIYRK